MSLFINWIKNKPTAKHLSNEANSKATAYYSLLPLGNIGNTPSPDTIFLRPDNFIYTANFITGKLSVLYIQHTLHTSAYSNK